MFLFRCFFLDTKTNHQFSADPGKFRVEPRTKLTIVLYNLGLVQHHFGPFTIGNWGGIGGTDIYTITEFKVLELKPWAKY